MAVLGITQSLKSKRQFRYRGLMPPIFVMHFLNTAQKLILLSITPAQEKYAIIVP